MDIDNNPEQGPEIPFFENPHFHLPLPDHKTGSAGDLKQELDRVLFVAIEKTLMTIDQYDTQAAMEIQLDYAAALAKNGYPERAEGQFKNVLNQVDLGRGSLRHSDGNIGFVDPTQFTRDQSIWYARTAKKIADAGFVDLADEVLERSQRSRSISLDVDDDQISQQNWSESLGRTIRDSNASADIISVFVELEQYDTASELLRETSPSPYNFEKFLELMDQIASNCEESGDHQTAQLHKDGIADLLGEIKTYVEETLERFSIDGNLFGLFTTEISKLVGSAADYGVDMDFEDLLSDLKEEIDRREYASFDMEGYCWLAELYHDSGDSDTAFSLLQQLIAAERKKAVDDPEYEISWRIESISRAFAYIGSFEHSEALREELPEEMQSDILHQQLKYALKKEDPELILEVGSRVQTNLSSRMEEDKIKREPEYINYIGIDLLLAYNEADDHDAFLVWLDKFMTLQEEGSLYEVGDEKIAEVISILYKHGDIERIFEIQKVLSTIEMAQFMVRLLEGVDDSKLPQVLERVSQYRDGFSDEYF